MNLILSLAYGRLVWKLIAQMNAIRGNDAAAKVRMLFFGTNFRQKDIVRVVSGFLCTAALGRIELVYVLRKEPSSLRR